MLKQTDSREPANPHPSNAASGDLEARTKAYYRQDSGGGLVFLIPAAFLGFMAATYEGPLLDRLVLIALGAAALGYSLYSRNKAKARARSFALLEREGVSHTGRVLAITKSLISGSTRQRVSSGSGDQVHSIQGGLDGLSEREAETVKRSSYIIKYRYRGPSGEDIEMAMPAVRFEHIEHLRVGADLPILVDPNNPQASMPAYWVAYVHRHETP